MTGNICKHLSFLVHMVDLLELDDYTRRMLAIATHANDGGGEPTLGFPQDLQGKDLVMILFRRVR
jgi:hypothetical protein